MPRLCLAALLALLLAACGAPDPVDRSPAVTGSVTYRQRIALPPDAVLEVQLLDLTRTDIPAVVLHSVTVNSPGPVPIYFKIRYDAARIDPARVYALRASILFDGEARFVSTGNTRVLTGGHPDHLNLVLEMVRSP